MVIYITRVVVEISYPKEMLEEVFDNDFKIAHDSANELLADMTYSIVKGVIIEMCFQLGKPSYEVQKDVEALKNNDLETASKEMIDSSGTNKLQKMRVC